MNASRCPANPSPRRRAEGGFTIAELAIAVLVFALAITSALAAMQRAYLHYDSARCLQLAGGILQCEMEKERLFDWAAINDASFQPPIDASFLRNPAVAGRFTLSRSLTAVPDRNGLLVQVILTVTWRTFEGRSVSRTYTSYFCRDGLYNRIYLNV